jgi:uncharacterized SAM-binding protein YcdF (DUF218 family)
VNRRIGCLARSIGLVLVAGFLVYTVSLIVVLVVSQRDQRHPADAIVVLGAAQYNGRPSPVLKARLDHAAVLYRDHLAPLVLVTGGVGRGDRYSEGAVGRAYLLEHDLPDSAVVSVPVGRSTEGSMDAVAQLLRPRGLDEVLLVSDPFHMARLVFEARRTHLGAYTSPTGTSPISDNPNTEIRYLLREAFKLPVVWLLSRPWSR